MLSGISGTGGASGANLPPNRPASQQTGPVISHAQQYVGPVICQVRRFYNQQGNIEHSVMLPTRPNVHFTVGAQTFWTHWANWENFQPAGSAPWVPVVFHHAGMPFAAVPAIHPSIQSAGRPKFFIAKLGPEMEALAAGQEYIATLSNNGGGGSSTDTLQRMEALLNIDRRTTIGTSSPARATNISQGKRSSSTSSEVALPNAAAKRKNSVFTNAIRDIHQKKKQPNKRTKVENKNIERMKGGFIMERGGSDGSQPGPSFNSSLQTKLMETLKTALAQGVKEGKDLIASTAKELLQERTRPGNPASEIFNKKFSQLTVQDARQLLNVTPATKTSSMFLDQILKEILPLERTKREVDEILEEEAIRPRVSHAEGLNHDWERVVVGSGMRPIETFLHFKQSWGVDLSAENELTVLSEFGTELLSDALAHHGSEPEAFELLGKIWFKRIKLNPDGETNERFREDFSKPFCEKISAILKPLNIRIHVPFKDDPIVYVGNKGYKYTELTDEAKSARDGGEKAAREMMAWINEEKVLTQLSPTLQALAVITHFAETSRGFNSGFQNTSLEYFMEGIISAAESKTTPKEKAEAAQAGWDNFLHQYTPASNYGTDLRGTTHFPPPNTIEGMALYNDILKISSTPTRSEELAEIMSTYEEIASRISESEVNSILKAADDLNSSQGS
jgi:hypothetical protein